MTTTATTTAPSKTEAAYNADPTYQGQTLTFGEIEALWIKANPTQAAWAPLMAGIAEAESGGRTGALNDAGTTTGASADYSVGLWQINYLGSLLTGRTQEYGSPGYLQQNPLAQAQAAGALLGNGAGISNWEGDPVGQYFMNSSSAPSVSQVLAVVSQKGYDQTQAFDPSTVTSAQLTSITNPIGEGAGIIGQTIEGGDKAIGDAAAKALGLGGATSALNSVDGLIGWISTPDNWKRAGVFVGGIALVVGGIILFVATSKTGQTAVSDAGQAGGLAALAA